jgi:hypothetical protein
MNHRDMIRRGLAATVELSHGKRFGIHHVDFATRKASAAWYTAVIRRYRLVMTVADTHSPR